MLPVPSASLANPVADSTPLEVESGKASYYLEFNLTEAPLGRFDEQVEGWYMQRFTDALDQLRPTLQSYIDQGVLESYSINPRQFRLTLVNADSLVLDELGRSPEVMNIYPLERAQGVQGEQDQDSLTRQKVDTAAQQVEVLPEEARADASTQGQAPDDVPVITPGHFRARQWDNSVDGYTITPGAAYVASVTRDGSLLAQTTGSSDSGGYYYFEFYDFGGNYIKMKPGDVVTVSAAGDPDTSLTLPEIIVQVDATQDTVKMIAPAYQPVNLWIYTDVYYNIDGTTSAEGSFTADFTSQTDILYNDYGYVYYTDALDTQNQVYMYYHSAELYIRINRTWIDGSTGQVGAGMHQVLVTQYSADGSFERSVLADADNYGYFWVSMNQNEPGKRIEFTSPVGELVSIVIPNLTVTADPVTDIVSGQAPPNSGFEVNFYDRQSDTWYHESVTADASGFYSTNFGGAIDISARDYAYIYYYLPDGNWVYINYTVPYITVDLAYGDIYGYVEPDASVTAYLKDSYGSTKAVDYDYSDSDGWFYTEFWDYLADAPYDILPGDSVMVVTAANSFTVVIPTLTTSVDQAADLISGQAVPNMLVETWVCWLSVEWGWTECDGVDVFADALGNYSASYSGVHDIRGGDEIDISYTTTEGHLIADQFYLPNRIYVNQWENYSYIYTTADSSVDVTLRDSSGTVKAFYSGSSSYSGYLYLGTLGDIAPGDTLEVVAPGGTTQVNVVGLQITGYDRLNDILTGSGPANGILYFSLDDQSWNDGYADYIQLDWTGNFTIDLAGQWDLRGGDNFYLRYVDPNGSAQLLEGYVPGMVAIPSYNEVWVWCALQHRGRLSEGFQRLSQSLSPGDRRLGILVRVF